MNPIKLSHIEDASVSIAPESIIIRNAALTKSKGVLTVVDEFGQSLAADALSALHGIVKATEDSRKEIKKPVIALSKTIDKLAAYFTVEVDAEKARISGLLAGYATALEKQAALIEAKMQEAIRAMEEARLKAAAYAQKAQQEAEAKIANAKSAKAQQAAKAALEESKAKAEVDRINAEQKMNAALATKTEVSKAEGATTKTVWKFEVTDLAALYQHNPNLVRMEANAAAINGEILAGITKIPGIRIYSEINVIARRA